jgi:hypothetical protein
LGYAYWQIRELDPEGGCKEMKYWSLCWNAWEDSWMSGLPWRFRALPTDQEMIDRFRKHHGDFEAMKDKAVKTSQGDIWREWEDTSGVYRSEPFASYPRTPEEKARHTSRTWAYSFRVEDTRYVKDASIQDLAMLMRTKGYVYFRSPPQIEDGYLRGLPGQPKYLFRVLPSLDGPPWPSDWKSGDCWLRQIEPQWFLALCRDRVGG